MLQNFKTFDCIHDFNGENREKLVGLNREGQ